MTSRVLPAVPAWSTCGPQFTRSPQLLTRAGPLPGKIRGWRSGSELQPSSRCPRRVSVSQAWTAGGYPALLRSSPFPCSRSSLAFLRLGIPVVPARRRPPASNPQVSRGCSRRAVDLPRTQQDADAGASVCTEPPHRIHTAEPSATLLWKPLSSQRPPATAPRLRMREGPARSADAKSLVLTPAVWHPDPG